MAIGTLTSATAAHLYGVNSKPAKQAESKKTGIVRREEKVEFSSESKEANEKNELEKIIDSTPDVRIQIVEDLKAKIKSNDYPIENKIDEVVRRMIRDDPFSSVA